MPLVPRKRKSPIHFTRITNMNEKLAGTIPISQRNISAHERVNGRLPPDGERKLKGCQVLQQQVPMKHQSLRVALLLYCLFQWSQLRASQVQNAGQLEGEIPGSLGAVARLERGTSTP